MSSALLLVGHGSHLNGESAVAVYRRPLSSTRSGLCVAPVHCTDVTSPNVWSST